MKYYIDACIWRDYFEDRKDRFRPLGEWAFKFIKKIIEEEGIFVISDHLLIELESYMSSEEIKDLFEIVPEKLRLYIEANEKQNMGALNLCKRLKIPFGDCLHYILARDNDALLISRDRHFINFKNMKKPEELI